MPEDRVERRLTAILSADAVGYSRLMAEDEAATVHLLAECRHLMSDKIGQYGGRVVDAPGDNVLAEFPSVVDAVACAVEIQRELARTNAELPERRRMPFRIGVNLGDVVIDGERIYGDGVNVAARLESLAEPGGICISGKVHDEVEAKLGLPCRDLGDQAVKNIPRPVRAYRVEIGGRPIPQGGRLRRARRAPWVGLALGGAAFLLAWRFLASEPQTPVVGPEPFDSLAVLPLENLSANPEEEYFAAAMTEALIGDLAKIASLGVVSRTTVMQYAGARKPIPQIADELGVDAVLEGTVVRAGGSVRITAQLIDGRTDRHLWSESYERDLRDVLALQSEVARAIAAEIQLKLAPADEARLADARPVDPEAFEAYLKGVHFLKQQGASNHGRAVGYLERAVELDPNYAAAWARLADAYT